MRRQPWDITREMFLSLAEVDRLRAHLRQCEENADDEDRAARRVNRLIIETLLFSGLRCSEFCALRLADAPSDARQRTLTVGRGDAARRVFLPRHVCRLLREYVRDLRPQAGRAAKSPAGDALVLNERGKPYERTGLYRRVVEILSAAGLAERASVQLLRHTYGYLAYLHTGGNLLFVQRQLGHAHPMITSIYAQFVEESYADLADRLAADAPPITVSPPVAKNRRRIAKPLRRT